MLSINFALFLGLSARFRSPPSPIDHHQGAISKDSLKHLPPDQGMFDRWDIIFGPIEAVPLGSNKFKTRKRINTRERKLSLMQWKTLIIENSINLENNKYFLFIMYIYIYIISFYQNKLDISDKMYFWLDFSCLYISLHYFTQIFWSVVFLKCIVKHGYFLKC